MLDFGEQKKYEKLIKWNLVIKNHNNSNKNHNNNYNNREILYLNSWV